MIMSEFSDPKKVVKEASVTEGMQVADFGAGSGMYTLALAEAAGDTGKVYAVEVQKDLVATLSLKARESRKGNVEVVWGDIEREGGTKLRNASVDLVLVANVLFQAPDRAGIAREAWRVLKNGGKAIVIDWSGSFGGAGPTVRQLVRADEARRIFEGERFRYEKPLFDAGAHHYGIVMKKNTG